MDMQNLNQQEKLSYKGYPHLWMPLSFFFMAIVLIVGYFNLSTLAAWLHLGYFGLPNWVALPALVLLANLPAMLVFFGLLLLEPKRPT